MKLTDIMLIMFENNKLIIELKKAKEEAKICYITFIEIPLRTI